MSSSVVRSAVAVAVDRVTGKAFRFVRKVRRRMTCLYVPPYAPLLRKGARGNVKTIPTPVVSAPVAGGWW